MTRMSPSSRSTSQQVQFGSFGGVDVLEVVDVPRPSPGPGEVLVEVFAAGINHIEAYIRQGRFPDEVPTSFPNGQGSDFAGCIAAVGEGVTRFRKGQDVLGHTVMAAHATHVVVPAGNVVLKPAQLPWEVAGGLFLAGLVAHDVLHAVTIGEGDTLVVTAAAGGVGSIQAQLAMRRGARVIGTCGERNFDYLRQVGVTPVVYGDGLAERIRAAAPNGVQGFIDNFGGGEAVAEELGVAGKRFSSSDDRRELELEAVLPPVDEDDVHRSRTLATVAELAAKREVDVLVSGYYPLAEVQDAFDDLERRHARGKIVLGMRPVHYPGDRRSTAKARDVAEGRA
ncbi:NADP-dependent oxidoreductase [Clavibacter capsici]|nr:NADP-dependent oxidoreductase [Clavibacter capsici]